MNLKEKIKDQIINQTISKLNQKVLGPTHLQTKERISGTPVNNKLYADFHTIYNRVTIQVYNLIKSNL